MGDCSISINPASFSFVSSLKRPKTVFRFKRQVDLIVLIFFPLALQWSRKSQPLHAKGLEQVLKWLDEINLHYGNFQDEAGPTPNKLFKSYLF